MNWSDFAGIGLLAVGGFLIGGAYTTWRGSRAVAAILAVAAALSITAALAWLL